ncbi:hypothetical protein [Tumebacillus permanentifrigoris]|uniref:Uncharacterized protein n=1 Tax=Tumebacillus permanentifrigoris TaxID=378543 RepID=A0A316DBQ3_9BACL|nr:hypothetical protein [Tumebacillus permanentifrigoris]PWK14336.1 hypothetical protein C7459_10591 [Tumebacillus permanentifrigoris]
MLTEAQVQELQVQWEESLPEAGTAGEPFYTLMKFDGDRNTGELFAYPGLPMSFGQQAMVTTLFPTPEIGLACAHTIAVTNPEWRLVGVSEAFLSLIVELVRWQEIHLTVSLSVEEGAVVEPDRLPELVAAIREHGFSAEFLDK